GVLGNNRQQLVDVERLGKPAGTAEILDLLGRLVCPREDDDRRVRRGSGAVALYKLAAAHTRHVEIEQDQIWLPVAEDLERLGAARRRLHVAPLDGHENLDHLAEAILVFDDEDAPRLI